MHGIRHKRTTGYTDEKPVNRHVTTDTLGFLAGGRRFSDGPVPSVDLSATVSRCTVRAVSHRDTDVPRPCSPDSVTRCLLHSGSTHSRSTRLEESITGLVAEIPKRITTTKRADRDESGCSCWMP
jgi:hypothetical protein